MKNHSAEAILHYYGATEMEPTTSRRKCTEQNPCYVVNCPYRYYPNGTNTSCLAINDLEAKADKAPPTYSSGTSEEHFLNFGFPGPKGNQPASINGRQFEFNYNFPWWLSNQTKICSNKKCGFDKICKCNHNLKLEYNKTIQMVFTNMGNGTGWSHPIHMHGHTFYVLKMGFSVTDQTTARNIRQNPDINCGGGLNFCNNASWSNKTWADGNIPGLNLKNPPRKDTIIVPTGGYVVLRIRSDNPGRWFMHCHIEVHQIDGMAMFIDEAPDKQSSLPKGFPQCKSFNIEGHQHNGTTKREQRGKLRV